MKLKKLEWTLRLAMFGEFAGHGVYAWRGVPGFQALLTGATGVSSELAPKLLAAIGAADFIVALLALVRPIRVVLLYAAVWGLLTGLARPWSGHGEIWAFVERWPNWGVPLALLWLRGWPSDWKSWLR